MKLFFLFVFCTVFCDLNAQIEFYDCPKEAVYKYVSNARLLPSYLLEKDSGYYNWKIETGNSIIFKYEHRYDCSKTGHLEVIGSFFWSIPKSSTEFEIQLEKIDSILSPFLYNTACGPPCRQYNFEMTQAEGSIKGSLVGKVWIVQGHIKMQLLNKNSKAITSKDLVVDGTYALWKQKNKDKKGHKFNGF
jgi:hypothetical protein